jgi:autotransporter translocation and assembly factor TamB
MAFKFDDFPAGQLEADVTGSTTAAQVKALKLKVADAGLSLVGEADWQAVGPRWRVQAEAHDFNPGWFAPEWPGSLSFQLASAGTPQTFSVDLSALSGSLRQHPLEGAARISRRGTVLEVPSLALRAGGGELTASGGVGAGQSLAFALHAPDLKALWPEGAGAIDATRAGAASGGAVPPCRLHAPRATAARATAARDASAKGRQDRSESAVREGRSTGGAGAVAARNAAGSVSSRSGATTPFCARSVVRSRSRRALSRRVSAAARPARA